MVIGYWLLVIGYWEYRRRKTQDLKTQEPGKQCMSAVHRFFSCILGLAVLRLPDGSPFGFDVGVDADDDGLAVDAGLGGLVAVAAGNRERLAGGRRTRSVQRDFNVQDVVLDGCFHGVVIG